MADENTTTEPTAPAEPPKVAPSAPEPPKATAPEGDPDWLPRRLEQAKSSAQKAVLDDLGFDDSDSLKNALSELKTFREQSLSDKEKLESRVSELTPQAERAASLESTVKSYADRELSSLTDAQKQAVSALAGDDPSKVLGAIEALKPTWQTPAQETAPEVPETPNTTTVPKGPEDSGTTSPPDAKAEFARAIAPGEGHNPFKAARLLEDNRAEIVG